MKPLGELEERDDRRDGNIGRRSSGERWNTRKEEDARRETEDKAV